MCIGGETHVKDVLILIHFVLVKDWYQNTCCTLNLWDWVEVEAELIKSINHKLNHVNLSSCCKVLPKL